MKIGVITFSQSKDNYGQILQCYAMQKFLKKLGHDPFLIQYQDTPAEGAKFKWYKLPIYLCKIVTYISWYYGQKKEANERKKYQQLNQNVDLKFHEFLEDNVILTPLHNHESIMTAPPVAEAYVCGSDQIWGGDDVFYLSFAPANSKKIAYAPSLGGISSFAPEKENSIKQLLDRFDFIGMREQSGVEFCHRLGFTRAVKVVDPTLLLEKEEYDRIKTTIQSEKPYIFVYLLGNPTACTIDEIQEYAKSIHKEVVYVSIQGRVDGYPKTAATIGEWIGYLAAADMVITNSFHCVVFSLIYNKQFISLPLNKGFERMNCRLEELLSNAKLQNRIWNHNLELIGEQEVNFCQFKAYHQEEIKNSEQYLSKYLK